MPEWFANESFWTDLYDYLFGQDKFERSEEELKDLLELIEFKGHHILDLCCGPGRHSTTLAGMGYDVTGVDKSPFLLNKAKLLSKSLELNVNFIEEDMRSFSQPDSFDLVINMFTSFGYFENQNDDITVLQNIFDSLKTGGRFVIESMSKEILSRIFHDTTSELLDDGTLLVQKHKTFDDWGMVSSDWYLLKENKYKKYSFTHRLYSAVELKQLAKNVGFKSIRFYGSLKGAEYDNNAQRLLLVAEK